MSDLIVDFPQQRYNFPINKKARKPGVQFAPMSEIRFFEQDEKMDTSKIWYSNKEYKAMRMSNHQAIKDVYARYLSLSSSNADSTTEVLGSCVMTGIENLLTPKIINKVKACRSKHQNAVLDEQERQDTVEECDPIKLAYASHHNSKWSTRRAQTIGMLQTR